MKTSAHLISLLFICLAFSHHSCKNSSTDTAIKVNGNVKNIPADKIYITDAYYWEELLDSSEISDGKFQFVLDQSKYREPFFASICIVDSFGKMQQLGIVNYKRTNSKDTFSNSSFMLSFGVTEISGDFSAKYHRVQIVPTTENDLMFDERIDTYFSRNDFNAIQKVIKEYPSSYYLLNKVDENKHRYSSEVINSFLGLFRYSLQTSETGQLLKDYAVNITKKDMPFANLKLINLQGKEENLFNDSAHLYMLVFWASWCGPCRLEIPELKKIHAKFPKEKLQLVSISTDEDKSKWTTALNQEKMEWSQYLVPQSIHEKTEAVFKIGAIPLIIFVDREKRELKRFTGYSKDNCELYKEFIDNYISAR
jgi:thiol-disulfide isomerase/thioredoxin